MASVVVGGAVLLLADAAGGGLSVGWDEDGILVLIVVAHSGDGNVRC